MSDWHHLLDNDPLFIILFVWGSAVGVIFALIWTYDLLGWMYRLVFRRRRVVPQSAPQRPVPLQPPVVHLGETFDQLDAVVDDLANRVRW